MTDDAGWFMGLPLVVVEDLPLGVVARLVGTGGCVELLEYGSLWVLTSGAVQRELVRAQQLEGEHDGSGGDGVP
jgi:hypothetical protein